MKKQNYKQKCYDKYGKDCFFCNDKKSNIIHFIDGNRSNTSINNIRPSCSECYAKIHDTSEDYVKWTLKLNNPPISSIQSNELLSALDKTKYNGSTL